MIQVKTRDVVNVGEEGSQTDTSRRSGGVFRRFQQSVGAFAQDGSRIESPSVTFNDFPRPEFSIDATLTDDSSTREKISRPKRLVCAPTGAHPRQHQ